MNRDMATMHTPHRRSLWFNTLSSSSPSSEHISFHNSHRYSTMPSASTIFEKLHDMGDMRPRSGSKGSKDGKPERRSLSKKDSAMNVQGSPKRPSVASSGLVGSIKGRLSRKRSSPLLSNLSTFSEKNPILESPTTPTGPGLSPKPLPMLGSPFDRYTLDDSFSPSNANFDASKVNFDGSTFRHSRRDSEYDSNDPVDISKSGYRALPLKQKDGRLLHPYSLKDAPFVRAYNKVDLENDLYTNALLRRINPTGTPVFCPMELPPVTILDLGCGQGHWVADASKFFTQYGTTIIGFDLVDMVNDEVRDMPSVSWKRGNFVSYLLPFKSETFDFVRISNLTDSIPQNRWQHVLSEAYRILKPSGFLEIIDDELMFPYVKDLPFELAETTTPSSSSGNSSVVNTARSSWSGAEIPPKAASILGTNGGRQSQDFRASFLEMDVETLVGEDSESIAERSSIETAPSLYRGQSPSEASAEFLPTPTEEESLETIQWRTPNLTFSPALPSPGSIISLCQDVEGIYETMLEGRYGINPRPHEHILKLLLTTFGPGRSGLAYDFRLSLLSEVLDSLVASTKESNVPIKDKKSKKFLRFNAEAKIEEECRPDRIICDQVQNLEVHLERRSKAMKMLGMNDSEAETPKVLQDPIGDRSLDEMTDNDEVEDPSMRSRSSSSSSLLLSESIDQTSTPKRANYQPRGLFLHPDKFLDTSPRELEMYVGKHVQAVLGSNLALEEHVLSLRNEDGEPIVNEEDWREMMWEYECSRYSHFNLPQNDMGDWENDDLDQTDFNLGHRKLPDPVTLGLQKQFRAACTSSGPESASNGPSTLVRRIRVYTAQKPK